MSKTIRVIDLLNKIANGEEVSETARYFHRISRPFEVMLVCKENIIDKLDKDIIDLNDEVEVIEEQQDIDIQSIEEIEDVFIENSSCGEDVKYLARKYNEILKWAKQLDKKTKEKE